MKTSRLNTQQHDYKWLINNHIEKHLTEYVPYYKGVMLDFRYSNHRFENFFKQYSNKYITINHKSIKYHNQSVNNYDLNTKTSLDDTYADTIIALNILEHLYAPQTFLNECYRVLKDDGTLVLNVPFQHYLHEAPNDYFRFTPYGLKYLLEKAEFENIHIQPIGGFYTTIFVKLNHFSLRLIKGSSFKKRIIHLLLKPFWFLSQKLALVLDKTHRGWSVEAQSFFVTAKKHKEVDLKTIQKNIIVSLTSYGSRIETVHLVIETILKQTYQVDKIILWLDEVEFSPHSIPDQLKQLSNNSQLEINFCKDIKSYKKLIPTLKLYPNETIITIDDDIYYEKDLIKDLLIEHLKYPNTIICARAHKMLYNKNSLLSYNDWEYCTQNNIPSMDIFPTSGAGTLFPPNSLHTDTIKDELFMELSPTADDVWFKAMSLLQNTPCKVINQKNKKYSRLRFIDNTQEHGLCLINIDEKSGNNKQLQQVFKYYDLFKKLQK